MGLIHSEECAALAVTAVVGIAITDLHEDGDALVGLLTLTRREGEEPVTATRLERSVLIDAVAELPLELDANDRTAEAEISFTAANCEPHVLSETKKPFVFPLSVTVGGDDEVPVDLPLDQSMRDEADRARAAGVHAAGLTGKEAGPAAPGGTGQPGRGRYRRALARGADDSAVGWQGDVARPPDRSGDDRT